MVLRKLFPVLFLFVAVNATAQPIKTQTTAQLLKTASTLLQAQQLEAAEEYITQPSQKPLLQKIAITRRKPMKAWGIFTIKQTSKHRQL